MLLRALNNEALPGLPGFNLERWLSVPKFTLALISGPEKWRPNIYRSPRTPVALSYRNAVIPATGKQTYRGKPTAAAILIQAVCKYSCGLWQVENNIAELHFLGFRWCLWLVGLIYCSQSVWSYYDLYTHWGDGRLHCQWKIAGSVSLEDITS